MRKPAPGAKGSARRYAQSAKGKATFQRYKQSAKGKLAQKIANQRYRNKVAWTISSALEQLREEINAAAPERSKASDGGIGDEKHSSKSSDHNPCGCHSVVCARDFTHDPTGGLDGNILAAWLQARALAGETRIKYVIWNKQIMSGPGQSHPVGVWRKYTGSNPHQKHLHLSVTHAHHDDASEWGYT